MTARKREPGKLHQDVNEIAFRTVQAAIGEAEKPIRKMEDLLGLMDQAA